MEVDVRPLMLYTDLYDQWVIYNEIISISEIDSNGLLSLSAMNTYLQEVDITINCSKRDFFSNMSSFLIRQNAKILEERERKRRK